MNSDGEKTLKADRSVLLSICIPTFKRPDIIRELINSIISQEVNHKSYEIRITDNSETDETKDLILKEFSDVDNLYYKKVDCKGFYNSIEALKYGEGRLLKLHNDYSIFKPGALAKMISLADREKDSMAHIFFSLGSLKDIPDLNVFTDYNSFMDCIGYQATWSSAFAIWKEDFDMIMRAGIEPDTMYPHTSFLHRVTSKERFIVDNYPYVTNIEPKKKGGYNLIDNFVRIYLTMVRDDLLDKNLITENTYDKIETGILAFCADWYYVTKENPEKYTFKFDNAEEIILNRCGEKGVKEYKTFLKKRKMIHDKKVIKERIKRIIKPESQ